MADGVNEFFDTLESRADAEKLAGLDTSYLFDIEGAGQWLVQIYDGHVHVTYTLTTPGCPIGPMVDEQIEEFVGEVEGVKAVSSEMVFTPAWSPERMSEDAKFALGY